MPTTTDTRTTPPAQHEAHGRCRTCKAAAHRYGARWDHVMADTAVTGSHCTIDPEATCCPAHAATTLPAATYPNAKAAAKAYAARVGIAGRKGGWLYNATGVSVCHGWDSFVGILASGGILRDLNGDRLATRTGVKRAPGDRWSADLRNVFDGKPVVLTDRMRRIDATRAARALCTLAGAR